MTPAQLEKIGEEVYGRYWQTRLAERLKVSDRLVSMWKTGKLGIREVNAIAIRGIYDEYQRSNSPSGEGKQ